MSDAAVVFEWHELATDPLCRALEDAAGVGTGPVDAVAPLVARILRHTGGLPVVRAELGPDERTQLGERLLVEAFRHTLHELGVGVAGRGVLVQGGRVVDVPRTNVNCAGAAELEALPGIGASMAAGIVEERLARGAFGSFADFDDRVRGVGPELAVRLRDALAFDPPAGHWGALPHDGLGLRPCLQRLLAETGEAEPATRLVRALELVAVACAAEPHPASAERRVRDAPPDPPDRLHATDEVVPLLGSAYYDALLDEIERAAGAIRVCMFHIALPTATHPTHRLLDALAAAAGRGVAVRVLVDLDEKDDPYQSEIINEAALAYLEARGVDCRSDARERLLHSKFVVLGDATAVIGSHNWSAGSYFQYDDASLLVRSQPFAAELAARFDALWDAALP